MASLKRKVSSRHGDLSTATVVAAPERVGGASVLVWNQKALAAHMLRSPEVSNKFEAMLAADLVRKLRQARPGEHPSSQNARPQLSRKRMEQARAGGASRASVLRALLPHSLAKGLLQPLVYGWHLKN